MFRVFSVISYMSLKLLEFQGPGVLHICNSSAEYSGWLINNGFIDAYEGIEGPQWGVLWEPPSSNYMYYSGFVV